jgi:hypothetical protein
MFEIQYYYRLESKWLKGKVRNLTLIQALQYDDILHALFGPKVMIRSIKH